MGKTRSRRPADDTQPGHRSPVELTAAASRAVDDGPSAPPAATPKTASRGSPDAAGVAACGVELTPSDSAADMLVKIAKEYQGNILDSIRLGLNAALDHAKNVTETPRETEGPSKGDTDTRAGAGLPTEFDKAAAAFQAETLELMKANVATSLNYARELAVATSAAEIAEFSGTQARRQCELMLKQAEAMKSLAESVTKSCSDEADS